MKRSGSVLFLILLLVAGMGIRAVASPQDILAKRITLHVQDKPLGKVLRTIEKISGTHFIYVNRYLPLRKKITVSADSLPLRAVLDEVLSGENIEYVVVEGAVVLRPFPAEGRPAAAKKKEKYTLSGYVRDAADGESLIGATVYVAGTDTGTVSNAYGFYSLTLPAGTWEIVFSYVGYRTLRLPIRFDRDITREVNLVADPALIREVIVTTPALQEISSAGKRLSRVDLRPAMVNSMPAFLGENDVIKSLGTLPGITFFGDGSTFFYVRGGNKDQNLIRIDDAPVFNPTHLFGFFSTVIPDAVKSIRVYKGDMPAAYGGRLSSLVDIHTRDGSMKRFGMSGDFGLVAGHLTLETPVVKDKSSLFIAGRHSYFKWFVARESPSVEDVSFGDLNVKFNALLNNRNRLYFSFYYGGDNYFNGRGEDDASGIAWKNLSGSLRWNHVFSTRLFANFIFYTGQYDYSLVTSRKNNDTWRSAIGNTGLRYDLSWYLKPGNTFRTGLNIGIYGVDPGNFRYGDPGRNVHVPVVPERQSLEWNLYGDYEWQPGERWMVSAGLRMTLWQSMGPTTEYTYDENHHPVKATEYPAGKIYNSYIRPEPRLGVRYALGRQMALKAGYNRNVQNIHQITNSVSPFTSLEVWLPSSVNIRPQVSDQVSVGFSDFFKRVGVDLNVELYYKYMQNQIDYEYHAQMLLNPYLEGELRFGHARAYGAEVMLKKETGKFTGWVGYALSRTTKKINGIYRDAVFPAFYDRRHDFSLFLSWIFFDRLTLSGTWIYNSGAAFSTPSSFYYYQGYSVPLYLSKNNDRLPPYHRLDLEVDCRLNREGARFTHSLTLAFYNVYGRKNPISVYFNKTPDASGTLVIPADYYRQPVLVPAWMWLYRMIPSLNYKFRF